MNKPRDGAWLSHVLVRLHLHTQSQFASVCFSDQPSKAAVLSQDKTHNEVTFCFENTFSYNWCDIQQDNKRTNLKNMFPKMKWLPSALSLTAIIKPL